MPSPLEVVRHQNMNTKGAKSNRRHSSTDTGFDPGSVKPGGKVFAQSVILKRNDIRRQRSRLAIETSSFQPAVMDAGA